MKLYTSPRAPNPRRVTMFMAEKQIVGIEQINVDINALEHRGDAFRHLNPLTTVPALALNAVNDPFVPAASLPTARDAGPCVSLWQPGQGGHVGFPSAAGRWRVPGHVRAMPDAVGRWLLTHTL